jgi:site-specific DNA-cytosine methylase
MSALDTQTAESLKPYYEAVQEVWGDAPVGQDTRSRRLQVMWDADRFAPPSYESLPSRTWGVTDVIMDPIKSVMRAGFGVGESILRAPTGVLGFGTNFFKGEWDQEILRIAAIPFDRTADQLQWLKESRLLAAHPLSFIEGTDYKSIKQALNSPAWWTNQFPEIASNAVWNLIPVALLTKYKLLQGATKISALRSGRSVGAWLLGAQELGSAFPKMRDDLISMGVPRDEATAIASRGAVAYAMAAAFIENKLLIFQRGEKPAFTSLFMKVIAGGVGEITEEELQMLTEGGIRSLIGLSSDITMRGAFEAAIAGIPGAGFAAIEARGMRPAPKDRPKITLPDMVESLTLDDLDTVVTHTRSRLAEAEQLPVDQQDAEEIERLRYILMVSEREQGVTGVPPVTEKAPPPTGPVPVGAEPTPTDVVPETAPTEAAKEPWQMTREEFIANPPKGYEYNPSSLSEGTLASAYKSGVVTVGDKFFDLSEDRRRGLLLHEHGHGLVRDFERDFKDVMEPFRLDRDQPISVYSKYRHPNSGSSRPEEIVSDVYENLFDTDDYSLTEDSYDPEEERAAFIEERAAMGNLSRRVAAVAIAAGKPVPAEVLADYPDLKPAAPDAGAEVAPATGEVAVFSEYSGIGTTETKLQGTRSAGASEINETFVEAFNEAQGTNFESTDATLRSPQDVIDSGTEVYIASPECTRVTILSKFQNVDQQDIDAAEHIARIIEEATPPVFLFENVKEYLNTKLFKTITDALDRAGYTWEAELINSADYGGVQTRTRLIIRAVRKGELPKLPSKTKEGDWWEAVEDLVANAPKEKVGEREMAAIQKAIDRFERRDPKERGRKLDPSKPIITMGGSIDKDVANSRNSGEASPTLTATPRAVPRIILPDGKVVRVTGEMMVRLMDLPDGTPLPGSVTVDGKTYTGSAAAKQVLGNGIQGTTTKIAFQPMIDLARDQRLAAEPAPGEAVAPAGETEDVGDEIIGGVPDIVRPRLKIRKPRSKRKKGQPKVRISRSQKESFLNSLGITGFFKEGAADTVTESEAIKGSLQQQARAAAAADVAATRRERAVAKEKLAEVRDEAKQKKRTIRQVKAKFARVLRQRLPKEYRGGTRLLAFLKNIETRNQLVDAINTVTEEVERVENIEARKSLDKTVARAGKSTLLPEFASRVETIIGNLTTKRLSKKKRETLESVRVFLDKELGLIEDGQESSLAPAIREALAMRVEELEKTPTMDLPTDMLQLIDDSLRHILHVADRTKKLKTVSDRNILLRRAGEITREISDTLRHPPVDRFNSQVPRLRSLFNLFTREGLLKLETYTEWISGGEETATWAYFYDAINRANGLKLRDHQNAIEALKEAITNANIEVGGADLAAMSSGLSRTYGLVGAMLSGDPDVYSTTTRATPITINLSGNQTLTGTSAEWMSLLARFMDPKQRLTMSNSKGAPIRFKRMPAGVTLKLAENDMQKIEEHFKDSAEAKIVGEMMEFINTTLRDSMRAWSEGAHGMDITASHTYYPMRREVTREAEGLTSNKFGQQTLKSLSIGKLRRGGSQPIIVGDFFSEFNDLAWGTYSLLHVDPAVTNAQRLLRNKDVSDVMKNTRGEVAIKKLDSYYDEMAREAVGAPDLNGEVAGVTKDIINKITRGVLGLNPRVATFQIVSMLLASTEIEAHYLVQALPVFFDHSANARMSPSLRARTEQTASGLANEFGGQQREFLGIKPKHEWFMAMIGYMDSAAIRVIWRAAELKVQATESLPNEGSEGYEATVGEVADRIVRRTQPMFDTLNISGTGLEARHNPMVRAITMFFSQRNQNINIVARALMRGIREPTAGNMAKQSYALSMVALSGLSIVAIRSLWHLATHGFDDDEDVEWYEQFSAEFISATIGNIYFGDIFSYAINSILFPDVKTYPPELSPIPGTFMDLFNGGIKMAKNADVTDPEFLDGFERIAMATATLAGYPVTPWREVKALSGLIWKDDDNRKYHIRY